MEAMVPPEPDLFGREPPDGERIVEADYLAALEARADTGEPLQARDRRRRRSDGAMGGKSCGRARRGSDKERNADNAERVGQTLDELISADPAVAERLEERGGKNLVAAIQKLVAGLRAGQFPARPQDCRFCSYRAVCRISERALEEEGS